jgi:hypothetical protein
MVHRSEPSQGFGQDCRLSVTLGRLDGGVIALNRLGYAAGSLLLLRVSQ